MAEKCMLSVNLICGSDLNWRNRGIEREMKKDRIFFSFRTELTFAVVVTKANNSAFQLRHKPRWKNNKLLKLQTDTCRYIVAKICDIETAEIYDMKYNIDNFFDLNYNRKKDISGLLMFCIESFNKQILGKLKTNNSVSCLRRKERWRKNNNAAKWISLSHILFYFKIP